MQFWTAIYNYAQHTMTCSWFHWNIFAFSSLGRVYSWRVIGFWHMTIFNSRGWRWLIICQQSKSPKTHIKWRHKSKTLQTFLRWMQIFISQQIRTPKNFWVNNILSHWSSPHCRRYITSHNIVSRKYWGRLRNLRRFIWRSLLQNCWWFCGYQF